MSILFQTLILLIGLVSNISITNKHKIQPNLTDGICELGYELFAVVDAANKSIRIIQQCNNEIDAKVERCKISGIEELDFAPRF